MIRLQHVSKSYRRGKRTVIVARDISIVFPKGARVGLLGHNGAGKLTLLKMIAGGLRPDSGVIRRRGTVSWPVGFSGGLHGDMSGAQNARFVARIYGRNPEATVAYCQAISGLGPDIFHPVRSYSAGMRARLAFALSMAIPFDYYLFDEITAVGDAAFRQQCLDTLSARLGCSGAIIASHAMDQIRALCTSAVVLENGRLKQFDDVEQAIRYYRKSPRSAAVPSDLSFGHGLIAGQNQLYQLGQTTL